MVVLVWCVGGTGTFSGLFPWVLAALGLGLCGIFVTELLVRAAFPSAPGVGA